MIQFGTLSFLLTLGALNSLAEYLLRHLLRAPLTLPTLWLAVAYDTVPATLRPLLST